MRRHQSRYDFVVSSPRSGSTWLMRMLDAHPELHGTEARLFGDFAEVWDEVDGSRQLRVTFDAYARVFGWHYNRARWEGSAGQFRRELLRDWVELLQWRAFRATGALRVVDKVTPYPGTAELVLKRVRKWLPKAAVVHLLRDGRDVATSSLFDWVARSDREHPRYARWVEGREVTLARLFTDAEVEERARDWVEVQRALRGVGCVVRYESLLASPEVELGGVCRALGVSDDREVLRRCAEAASFSVMSGGRAQGEERPLAKVRKGVAGDWRNTFTRRDGALFEEVAGDELRRWGYTRDDGWVAELPERLDG